MSILQKIRDKGFSWFFERLVLEYRIPETPLGKLIQPFTKAFHKLFTSIPFTIVKKDKKLDTLFFFYDFEICPMTYDFCWALALANMQRIKLGLKYLQVVFVPGPQNGLRQEMIDYEKVVNQDERHLRKHNLIFPITQMLTECRGLFDCHTREEADFIQKTLAHHVYPVDYSTLMPKAHNILNASQEKNTDIQALTPNLQALNFVEQWLKARAKTKKTIVITLRQYAYMPKRNSNIDAWSEFAKSLDPTEYFVVIVPDTYHAMDLADPRFSGFHYFTEACWNVELRLALYQSCYLNLGVNNGPFALCWLSKKCRYLMFKIVTEDVPQASLETLTKSGYIPGESPPFAQPYQKWIWESDTTAVITREFQKMCALLRLLD